MANACDEFEQPEIDYLFNVADEISESVNRTLSVEALMRFEAMVVERTLSLIEDAISDPSWSEYSHIQWVIKEERARLYEVTR